MQHRVGRSISNSQSAIQNSALRPLRSLWPVLVYAAVAHAQTFVWWEAEQPVRTNFPDRTWFDPQNDRERDKLSGGDWLTHIDKRPAGTPTPAAHYEVEAPRKARYALWARKMWKHGPFRWRFDDGGWQTCGRDVNLADSVTLRTHVPANWVYLGEVDLAAGRHTFDIELLADVGENQAAAFDCFMLINGPFVPRGKTRPGESSGRAAPGWFAFEPELDPFTDEAMLDLRSMNEDAAGQSGPLRREGDQIVRGDGEPIRLWAANVSLGNAGQNRQSIDYLARKLAKLGFNAVRLHSGLFDNADPTRIQRDKLDDVQYLVHAMNQQGIYVELSTYFPLWFNAKQAKLPGFDTIDGDKPFGLIFFDEHFQQLYRGWLKQTLTAPNPYGKPLAANPGVGIVEIVNEDSLFFWTFSRSNIPAVYWNELERRFSVWLKRRYGSHDQAYAAWGGAKLGEDAADSMRVREAWHMTGQGMQHHNDAVTARMRDQVRFLAEVQRDFYRETVDFIRSLGFRGLITASNWQTADAARLDRVERWTYTAADVIDRHAYVGGKHEGEGASYSVRVGHDYEDFALLNSPERFPVTAAQVYGYPQIISELGWPQPNRYRSESLPVSAAYASLQGIDGLFFFAVGSNYLLDQSMNKFQFSSPAIAFNSPAAAILYRRGDVAEAPPAVERTFDDKTLFNLEPEDTAVNAALDALREADLPEAVKQGGSTVFRAGPTVRRYVALNAAAKDLAQAPADQIEWDAEGGHVVINTPRTRGIIGYIKRATPIDLDGVVIQTDNIYGSVLVTSLDDRPLNDSKRILAQVMTEERPYGFATSNGRITDLGGAPFNMKQINCRITLPGEAFDRAVALDANGYPRPRKMPEVMLRGTTEQVTITLVDDSIYHIIER